MKSSLESRAEVHRRYNFSCQCKACQMEWPTEKFLVRITPAFLSLYLDMCLQPRNVNRTHLGDRTLSDKQVRNIDATFKKVDRFIVSLHGRLLIDLYSRSYIQIQKVCLQAKRC